jgi:hypothetical protein
MTNKRFWLGILVMVLVFGMTVVGCDDSSTDDDDGPREEAISLPATSGEFTFTDIPSKYNGKFALLEGYFSSGSRLMVGLKGGTRNTSNPNYLSTMTCVKIENGSINIPLYTFSQSSPVSSIQAYTGSDSAYVNILIYDSETIAAANVQSYNSYAVFGTASGNTPSTYPVQFNSGKVSKSNNDATTKLSN